MPRTPPSSPSISSVTSAPTSSPSRDRRRQPDAQSISELLARANQANMLPHLADNHVLSLEPSGLKGNNYSTERSYDVHSRFIYDRNERNSFAITETEKMLTAARNLYECANADILLYAAQPQSNANYKFVSGGITCELETLNYALAAEHSFDCIMVRRRYIFDHKMWIKSGGAGPLPSRRSTAGLVPEVPAMVIDETLPYPDPNVEPLDTSVEHNVPDPIKNYLLSIDAPDSLFICVELLILHYYISKDMPQFIQDLGSLNITEPVRKGIELLFLRILVQNDIVKGTGNVKGTGGDKVNN